MVPKRVFKLTHDDWHPSYKLNGWYKGVIGAQLVEVSLLNLSDGKFRVCVWGSDDCGMERDYEDIKNALDCFDQLLEQEFVDKSLLKNMEFVPA